MTPFKDFQAPMAEIRIPQGFQPGQRRSVRGGASGALHVERLPLRRLAGHILRQLDETRAGFLLLRQFEGFSDHLGDDGPGFHSITPLS